MAPRYRLERRAAIAADLDWDANIITRAIVRDCPLDLLRYVCEQSEAAAGREAKWKQAHRESEQAMDDLTR